jgi:hypothetical protein
MMTERKGNWYATNSGIQYWPLDPRPEEIEIKDIAHHLSLICRFGGAVDWFYSVAQHSVLCSQNVPIEWALEALLHDACEAYLGDMVQPIKHGSDLGDMFCKVEKQNRLALAVRYGLDLTVPGIVKNADVRMLLTEARDLFENSHWEEWALADQYNPYDFLIEPWTSEKAESMFLERFLEVK